MRRCWCVRARRTCGGWSACSRRVDLSLLWSASTETAPEPCRAVQCACLAVGVDWRAQRCIGKARRRPARGVQDRWGASPTGRHGSRVWRWSDRRQAARGGWHMAAPVRSETIDEARAGKHAGLDRALPAGQGHLPQRGHARRPLPPAVPDLLHPRPGPRKWDVDGNEYVDYFGGHGALLLGHNHPAIVDGARASRPQKGTHYGACHELEVRWGELVQEIVPSRAAAWSSSSLRHRGDDDGDAPGARLHRQGQDRQDPGRTSTAGTTTPPWPCSRPTTCRSRPASRGAARHRSSRARRDDAAALEALLEAATTSPP